LDFQICFEESSPDALATIRELDPAGEGIDTLLERESDAGDSHEEGLEYDVAIVRFSATLNDNSDEELNERAIDGWNESYLNSESQESAQEIWYDICALQRKVLRLASRMVQSGIELEMPANKPNPKDYTVGWICSGMTEYVAAKILLDATHQASGYAPPDDTNTYTLGTIGKHNVVMTAVADQALATAAVVANDMRVSFPNIEIGLLVGIGGGAPTEMNDICLGDIVVSDLLGKRGGGDNESHKERMLRGEATRGELNMKNYRSYFLNQLPFPLRAAVANLQAKNEKEGNYIEEAIAKVFDENPRLRGKYSRPDLSSDILFGARGTRLEGEDCRLYGVPRSERQITDKGLEIYFGRITSTREAVNDADLRDKLTARSDILCLDTVAAGVMRHFPCLAISSIYNYSDSHRNDEWAGYASMAAAAYAKELLYQIVPESDDK
jgi:nucleoside phosphorylase